MKLPALLLLLLSFVAVVSPVSAQTILVPEGNPAVSMDDLLSGARGIEVDAQGRVFVADTQNHVVRMFLPDGTPATIIGRIGKSERRDGAPAQARFNLPFRLAVDQVGGLLILDSRALVRRLDLATLTLQTVADLSAGVDGTAAYDVATGGMVDRGTLSLLQLGDLAVPPDGRVFITAADSLGLMQYLLLLTPPTARVIATSQFAVQQSSRSGPRGVAIDAGGNLFMPFPMVTVAGGEPRDIIFRFPNSNCQGVTQHLTPLGLPRVMTAGRGDRVYFATTAEDLIYSFSAATPDLTLGSVAVSATFPGIALQQVREITVGLRGELLAVNERQLDSSGVPTSPYSKVDCFEGADLSVGAAQGDTQPPTVTLTAPAQGSTVNAPFNFAANASDNSGQVRVQFFVKDREFGPPIGQAPFSVAVDPTQLPAGNLRLYAVAHDAAGNATTSASVIVFNPVGWPNLAGEVLVPDSTLQSAEGIATTPNGDIYVSDRTRVLRFSPLGTLTSTYGSTNAGIVDGDATSVRFADLRGLGTDSAGRVLIVDDGYDGIGTYGTPYIRRLDPSTGLVTTLYELDLDAAPQTGLAFSVNEALMTSISSISFAWAEARDVAGAPDGDLLVSASRLLSPTIAPYQFLLRYSGSTFSILAYHSLWLLPDSDARGVAVANDGTIFAGFQTDTFDPTDSLFSLAPSFPTTGLAGVGTLYTGLNETSYLAVDDAQRLYVACWAYDTNPPCVAVLDTTTPNTVLHILQHRLLDEPRDLAIDAEGNVYVVSSQLRYFAGSFRRVSHVTRFAGAARMSTSRNLPPRIITWTGDPTHGAPLGLRFETMPGAVYEISTAATPDGGWQVRNTITATGMHTDWQDPGFRTGTPIADITSRFYRIRLTGFETVVP